MWENRFGGVTWEVGTDPDRCFVKWTPAGSGVDLSAEAARLAWARPFTPVPDLVGQGSDESGSWLVTAALPGSSAAASRWQAEPARAVRAIGEGLRAMHESLPVRTCPFSWAATDRLDDLRRQVSDGHLDHDAWPGPGEPGSGEPMSAERALELLAEVPRDDQVVVCHGDSCAPNTLLADDGHWTGHVDLGELGVADRWADLAIATWSVTMNYGPGWEDLLLNAYGVASDPDRTAYYRLLGRCPSRPFSQTDRSA